jgi:tol-pal system protein YbgF
VQQVQQTVQKSAETKTPQPAEQTQPAQAAQAEPAQQAQSTPQQVAAAASPENVAQVSEIAQSSKQLYDNAYHLYQKRQYAEAEMAFNAFLEQYPQDVLAPNALYWKGETLYARALYPQAIFAFKDVQTRYPKHPKTADSLLKTAMSYARRYRKCKPALSCAIGRLAAVFRCAKSTVNGFQVIYACAGQAE